MKYQLGYDRKNKCPIEKELTYDLFVKLLSDSQYEFFFTYNENTIDVAFRYENGQKIFELNINGYEDEKAIRYEFLSVNELLEDGKIEGKRLKDIWSQLSN